MSHNSPLLPILRTHESLDDVPKAQDVFRGRQPCMLCRPPPLVTQRINCHCGRRVSHVAVVEGQQAAPLACDGECNRVNRQKQLAGAFGVVDPAQHVPVFDRQR